MAGERILLLLILMMPTGAWRRSQSTIFKKSTEVVITRSKWVLTLMIDLKPYHDLLERLASEIEKCKTDALGSCTSKSPMYTTGGHRLCLVELFRNNKEGIQQTCHVEVSRRAMMPQAIGLSDGVWAVVLERELALSQVCRGRSTVTIKAAPPLTVISLPMGCSAFGGSITLPPYYQAEEEFETRDSFLALSNVSSSRWAGLWEPLAEKLPVLNKAKLPQLLENIDNINLHKLVYKLETVGRENPAWYDQPAGTIAWSSLGVCVIVVIIVVVVLIIRGRQWLIRCRVKNMPEKRHSDQDEMSTRIAGTKETKDTALFPSMDQLDTACSVLEEPLQLGVIKVNA